MLDETLVIWGGEFGRTPMAQTNKGGPGRDHHMRAFSVWLAGGGIRGGQTYGATDDLGYHAVDRVVHVNDLHATMLHLLGIDHHQTDLSFFRGVLFRLTDVRRARCPGHLGLNESRSHSGSCRNSRQRDLPAGIDKDPAINRLGMARTTADPAGFWWSTAAWLNRVLLQATRVRVPRRALVSSRLAIFGSDLDDGLDQSWLLGK